MTERPSEAAFAAAVNAYMVSRLANNGPFDMDVVLRAAYAVDFPDEEPEMTLTLGATVTRNTLDLGGVPAAIDLRDMLMPVGPDNLTGGVPDEAVQVAFNATSLYGYPLGCGATAIRCVTDMLAVALPHLERAAVAASLSPDLIAVPRSLLFAVVTDGLPDKREAARRELVQIMRDELASLRHAAEEGESR